MEMTKKRHLFLEKWRGFPVTNDNKSLVVHTGTFGKRKEKIKGVTKGIYFPFKGYRVKKVQGRSW